MKLALFPKNILALFASLIFGNASERIIFPLFALVFFDASSNLLAMDASHATRSYWYGLCVALPSIGNFIASPVLSCLSDFYGRKTILCFSYLGTTLAGAITAAAILTQSIHLFVAGVFIQGIFSRTNPVGMAAIGDTAQGTEKLSSMGWVQSAIAFGAFLGPIIGGYLAHLYFDTLNFSAAFMLSALLSLTAFMINHRLFKETLKSPSTSLSFTLVFSSFTFLAKRKTLPLALIIAAEQFTWSLYYQYAAPTLKLVHDAPASHLGLFVGLMALWVVLAGSIGLSLITHLFRPLHNLLLGLVLQLIGALLIIVALQWDIYWLIWVSSLPMAAGDVIAFSVLITMHSNYYPDQQGQIMGACFLNAAAIWSITALLGGYLTSLSPQLPMLITPIPMLVALILAWQVKQNK